MSDKEKEPTNGETPPNQPAGSETPPADFTAWLATQPDDVRDLYGQHTTGLKSALDAERAANKEAARKLKRLEELERAEQERREAEMTETDKLKAENERLALQLTELQTNDLKRRIAAEYGLPDALALRLQGKDEDEMRADAEKLKAVIPEGQGDPAASPKPKPKITPTNPATGHPPVETAEQRRARLYGGGGNIFDPAMAETHGGGVVYTDKN